MAAGWSGAHIEDAGGEWPPAGDPAAPDRWLSAGGWLSATGWAASGGWVSATGWTRAEHPSAVALVAGLVALVAVAERRIWRISRNVVTIAHEGGHALIALLTGRKLDGIKLHSDTSGVTVSSGRPTGPGMVATAAAGYIAPSLLGLGAAVLLAAGHVTVLLWVSLGFLVALFLIVRNAYGAAALIVTGLVVGAAVWLAPVGIQAAFAYLETWFLLLGGVRPVFELAGRRRQGRARGSDADQLAWLTGLPGALWVTLFALVALVALALGVSVLGSR